MPPADVTRVMPRRLGGVVVIGANLTLRVVVTTANETTGVGYFLPANQRRDGAAPAGVFCLRPPTRVLGRHFALRLRSRQALRFPPAAAAGARLQAFGSV